MNEIYFRITRITKLLVSSKDYSRVVLSPAGHICLELNVTMIQASRARKGRGNYMQVYLLLIRL